MSIENENTALSKGAVVGSSDTVKNCQNCKFYTADKNRCNHDYWSLCIKRDDEGYVTSYVYHFAANRSATNDKFQIHL
jgi:hypothetical protein